jgi:hypothetical protein
MVCFGLFEGHGTKEAPYQMFPKDAAEASLKTVIWEYH